MNSVHSSREAGSAQGPPSATERRECKSRVTLLLRDADSGQIDHMAAEPTHGPHHPCTSSSRLGARGTLLAIAMSICPEVVGLTERALHARYARSSVQLVEAPDASCRHRAPQTWSHVAKLRARDMFCIQSTCSCTTGFPQLHPAPRQSDLHESMTPLKVEAEATALWMADCSAARVHDRTCNCDLGGSSRCGCGWRRCKQPAGIA